MACSCNCCLGACCYLFAETPQCSLTTCEECAELEGDWQGPGTACVGEDADECPCDPPADPAQCEKCVGGVPVSRCEEGQYCCDGVCQEEPCEPPPEECESDEDCESCGAGFTLVPGCSSILEDLKCCPDGSVGYVDDAGDPRFGRCLVDCSDGTEQGESGGEDPTPGYCCDGVCQEEPCAAECSEETLGEPCGDVEPYDEETGIGYICCYSNNAELGCFGFPNTEYACDEEEYCTQCGADGAIETRVGPYDSSFEASVAATAWFNDNCETGSTSTLSCDGGTTWYGFICCTDEVP